jgi:membrane protein required for beta-lactamase induction
MTLISALLGIAADRLLTHLDEYRQYDRFLQYVDWMRGGFSGSVWDNVGGLIVVLLPLWLTIGALQVWISDWLFGLVGLLFYVTVFVYCLGPRDLAADVETYCEVCDSSDAALRQRAAGRLLRGDQPPVGTADCARRVSRAVLVEAGDRLFAVLFWFALLGPLGAVMYRSAAVLYFQRQEEGTFDDSIAWLYGVLLWLPARLLALAFALSGHFDSALGGWRQAHQDNPQGAEGSERVLAVTGSAALGLDDAAFESDSASPVRAAMRLVWRTLIVWLVVLSLLVLAGWAG